MVPVVGSIGHSHLEQSNYVHPVSRGNATPGDQAATTTRVVASERARLCVSFAVLFLFLAFFLLIRTGSLQAVIAAPERVIYFSLLVLGGLAAIWGPGLLLVALLPERLNGGGLRLALSVIGAGFVGWIVFWAWFASPLLGCAVSATVLVLTAGALIARPESLTHQQVALPVLFTALIALFYLCIAGDHGGFQDGASQIAHRYWVSIDNKMPQIFADQILLGRGKLIEWTLGGWQLGDRPPLQTGMILTTYPFVGEFPSEPEWLRYRGIAYIALGIAVNILWVPAIWGFLRSLHLTERQIGLVVVVLAAVGAVFLNTVYAWPKMLAAAMILAAATILLTPGLPARAAAALAASAAALALLAHGAAAFGLIGLAPIALRSLRRWGTGGALVGVVVACGVYAPWLAYQKFFDPPSDRLLKWHLAGTSLETIDPRPALKAILSRYSDAGVGGVLLNKLMNVRVLLGDPTTSLSFGQQPGWTGHPVRVARVYLSNKLAPAPGILLLGILAIAFSPRLRKQAWVKQVSLIVIVTAIACCLLEFGHPIAATAWLQTSPYSLLLLWCAMGAIALVQIDTLWSRLALAAHFAFFYFVWVFGVTTKSAFAWLDRNEPLDLGMTLGAAICAAALTVLIRRSPDEEPHPDRTNLGLTSESSSECASFGISLSDDENRPLPAAGERAKYA